MKKLNSVENIDNGNVVILRMDTDLPIEDGKILDNSRLVKSIPTIKLLLERKNKIIILGHLGRPEGVDSKLSLKPIYLELIGLLEKDCGGDCVKNVFIDDIKDKEKVKAALENNEIIFGENLRFWKEEENGEIGLFDVLRIWAKNYVDDAFAVAHREAASVITHRQMESFYGLSFVNEYEKITKVLESEEKGLVVVLGGAKEDKLKYLKELSEKANWILIGGKLPKLMSNVQCPMSNEKVIVAELREDGLDLSDEDINKFEDKIEKSKIVVWAGAMGFYEKENCRKGTKKIAEAIANCEAYKIIAGGDTAASIVELGLKEKIDLICSGGGVMLEMLVKKDLPAWS